MGPRAHPTRGDPVQTARAPRRCATVRRMGRGDFRGAAGVAVAMAVATWLVAWTYDLPVRDPDGVSLPDLVAAAGDRAVRGAPRRRSPGGRCCVRATPRPGAWAALRTRGPRAVDARPGRGSPLSGLVTWYVAYVAFRNLKGYVPFVTDRLWDTELRPARPPAVARPRPGRRPPRRARHRRGPTGCCRGSTCCGSGWCRPALAIALVWTRRSITGALYVTADLVQLAARRGRLLPRPVPRADLLAPAGVRRPAPHLQHLGAATCCSTTASRCWPTPGTPRAVQTIAAFASLHVAIMVTIVPGGGAAAAAPASGRRPWAFLALTCVATVYLGWHFFVDVLGGFAVGAAGPRARRQGDRPPAPAPRPNRGRFGEARVPARTSAVRRG